MTTRRGLILAMMIAVGAMGLAACGKGRAAGDGPPGHKPQWRTLTGRLVYREKMLLPPGTRGVVVLTDRAHYGEESARLAEAKLEDLVAPPMAFRLKYDAARLQPDAEYGLRATIYVEGRPFFSTPELFLVDLTDGPPLEGVTVLVKRAGPERRQSPGG